MMTEIVEKESREENPSTLCGVPSIESQVKHSYSASGSQNEEKPWRSGLGDEIVTDVSECDLVVSKKIDNSYGDNRSIKSRNALANLGKISQSGYLEKCQPSKNQSDLSSIYGLIIIFCIYLIKLCLNIFYINIIVIYL